MKHLEPGLTYRAYYFNPTKGDEHNIGTTTGDEQGDYLLPKPPIIHDWVVVLEQ